MAAFLLIIVFVTIPIQRSFALNCIGENYEDFTSCDQCIQCGAIWCTNPNENDHHCEKIRSDVGCRTPDTVIYPSIKYSSERYFIEDTAKVDEEKELVFRMHTDDTSKMSFTRNIPNVKLHIKHGKCYGGECKLTYKYTVKDTFCSDTGEAVQNFNISVQYNETHTNMGLVHVACACQCSKNTSVNDKDCSGRGNLTCGVCTCMDEWQGDKCETRKPYDEGEYVETNSGDCKVRGDICTHELRPNVDCSGNGICDDCCKCDTNKDGWQYFKRDNFCEDLCMTTSVILEYNYNSTSIHFLPYNEAVLNHTDSKFRRIWVKCNETIHDVLWEYFARKNSEGKIAVMILKKSDPNAAAVVGGINGLGHICQHGTALSYAAILFYRSEQSFATERFIMAGAEAFRRSLHNNSKKFRWYQMIYGFNLAVTACVVPLVVGAVLTMAAVGYYVWQGKGAAPQPSRANYQGLDGPKTRVETNPVYIEPIKSYKNPTYGQNP